MTLLRAISGLALALCAAAQTYQEPYRPQVHFSPKQNWTNDPNGLVYFEGEYHLFFQYNPFGDKWGHMSWGHAVSTDLLHWTELPVALPEENGIMIFTGSVVVDRANSSGFCRDGKPCMVAIYTGHKPPVQTQNIAYSNDRGRTWTKYTGNPVLNLNMADFRDPNVLWSEAAKRWVMAVSLPNEHKVAFYGSADLKRWDRVSEFGPAGATGGQWECPDLVELPVDGDPKNTRWVLKIGLNPGGLQGGSGEQYFVGRFDGTRFLNENPASVTLWDDYGKDCYCGLTFNNAPKPTLLGWMSNWQYADKLPTHPWRGQMTIPREVSLKTFADGIRLVQKPVSLEALREPRLLAGAPLKGKSFWIEASFDPGRATQSGWKIYGANGAYTTIGYDGLRKELFVDRTHAGDVGFSKDFPARLSAPLTIAGPLTLHILIDANSVEVFGGGGRVVLTDLIFAGDPTRLNFFSEGAGRARMLSADVWPLRTIW